VAGIEAAAWPAESANLVFGAQSYPEVAYAKQLTK